MAVVTTNLGVITAYGDAVAAGYTGTKAEWQALMASYATVAKEAEDFANKAAKSATDADSAKDDAITAKNNAEKAKNDAITAKNAAQTAKTDAEKAKDDAQDIVDGINAKSEKIDQNTAEIEDLKEDLKALNGDLFQLDGFLNPKWILGGISRNTDGTLYRAANATRICTANNILLKAGTKVSLSSYANHRIYFFVSDNGVTFDSVSLGLTSLNPVYTFAADKYCAFVIVTLDDSSQTDTSASALFTIEYTSKIDEITGNIDNLEYTTANLVNRVNNVTDRFDRLAGESMTGETATNKNTAYKYTIAKGHTYRFTNRADAATTMNVYVGNAATPSSTTEVLHSIQRNYIGTFVASNNYAYIYVYATGAQEFTIEDLSSAIYHLEEVPLYYKDHIESKIREFNDIDSESGLTGDKFVFMTDYHRQANTENSNKLIKAILDNTNARFFLFGGDTQDYVNSISDGINEIRLFNEKFAEVSDKMYALLGNHEFNPWTEGGSIVSTYMLTYDQAYGMLLKHNEEFYGEISEYGNYWFDNKVQKIRYICTSCDGYAAMNKESVVWVMNAMKDAPSGYSIVILSHVTFDVSPTDNTKVYLRTGICWIAQAADAYNARGTYSYKENPSDQSEEPTVFDFSDCNGEVLCIIGGHTHFDMDSSQESKFLLPVWFPVMPDVMIVASTTDAYHRQNPRINALTRTPYTTSEQAFDIVALDVKNKTLKMVRVGAGYNRSYNLEVITEATTLTSSLSGTVTWTSSDTSVATVSDGTISKVSNGRTRIVAQNDFYETEVWTVKFSS